MKNIAIAGICIALLLLSGSIKQAEAQKLSKKELKLFNKAENLYSGQRYSNAEKLYTKITFSVDHGKSLKRLGDIEILSRENYETALNYYERAKTVMTLMKDSLGIVDNDLDIWISECDKGIDKCRQMLPYAGVSETGEGEEPEAESNKSHGDYGNSEMAAMVDFMLSLPVSKMNILFYDKGHLTTYYKYNEKPVAGYRLPDETELKKALEEILGSSRKTDILDQLEWAGMQIIHFVSSGTFYNNMNEAMSNGFVISRNSDNPEEMNIGLGDITIVLLIKD